MGSQPGSILPPRKPPELVEPDVRMQNMVISREALAEIADSWPSTEVVTKPEVASMLKTCRDLFVHCYFVYEFGLVAVIWSVLAVEAALRDCLGEEATRDDGLSRLIGKAQGRGWLTAEQAEALRAGAEFRNRITHARSHGVLTLPLVAGPLHNAHEVIVQLYTGSS
jgi:hypothetical protein